MDNKEIISKRKNLRLKYYDYSQKGLYFITICCQNRKCLFGRITNDRMQLYPAGSMIEEWYFELENKFPDSKCKDFIVMPNHFHCIIELKGRHLGLPLHEIIQWFKTMTTNNYIRNVKSNNWQRFDGKLWQRNYYEHIIRDEISHNTIVEYIKYNPERWLLDKYYE